jgi:predicted metal-binding membrane protein
MSVSGFLPRFFRPFEAVVWIGFFTLVLSVWAVLFVSVRASALAEVSGMPRDFWASLCLPADAGGVMPLIGMWGLMAGAMMLPTFVPSLRTYFDLGAAGATSAAGAGLLVAGYLAVWLGFAVLAGAAQYLLAVEGLVDPTGTLAGPFLTGALLVGAGAYQFTALKEACLNKCRMPIAYFMERWRPGHLRQFAMGLELGAVCLGCCWALMLLAFVGGTMNLLWMGAATLFMVFEKLPDIGRWLTRPLGAGLITWGLALLVSALIF